MERFAYGCFLLAGILLLIDSAVMAVHAARQAHRINQENSDRTWSAGVPPEPEGISDEEFEKYRRRLVKKCRRSGN